MRSDITFIFLIKVIFNTKQSSDRHHHSEERLLDIWLKHDRLGKSHVANGRLPPMQTGQGTNQEGFGSRFSAGKLALLLQLITSIDRIETTKRKISNNRSLSIGIDWEYIDRDRSQKCPRDLPYFAPSISGSKKILVISLTIT